MPATTVSITAEGISAPLGATVMPDGVNFSVFSRHATAVEILFFDGVDDARPTRTVRLDATRNRTYHYWHAFVPSVRPGQLYGYRVEGRLDPARGLCFDPGKVLLDPYGRGVAVPEQYSREAAARFGRDTTATAMKSVVVDPRAYDWEGDAPLRRPASRTIVYEMHVRGFTRHPSSGVADKTRGTYAGLIEKIPYLKDLGITALELLPVFQFDPYAVPPGLVNYWGYQPVSFFAPHQAYSSRQDPLGPIDEFRDMVKALHRAGLEVILDVVFNHTAEGGHDGPTLSFRGLDNHAYHILEDGMVGRFADRLVGSPELYAHKQREPEQSVNFVTCHDGFTLNDLVSYDRKHNEANRENNRDGGDDNKSWNCGVEGPTDDRAVERLRNRQVKNFLATTLLSIGLPMILMGDEVRRTQDGNNNLYCHDDERAWFDWTLLDRHRDVHRFVSLLNARRVLRSVRHEEQRLSLAQLIAQANKAWHGVTLDHADWSRGSHSLAFGAELKDERRLAHFIFNAYWEPLVFELPAVPSGKPWRRWIDTALDSPDDIAPWQQVPPIPGHSYRAEARSVVVLFADLG